MEAKEKVVNGVTYCTQEVEKGSAYNCTRCIGAAYGESAGAICGYLVTDECSDQYVWKIKDVTESVPKESTSEVQGMKFDDGKIQYSLVPPYALAELAKCLTFGAKKYAPYNWKRVSNPKVRYLDAALRHIELVRQGEECDQESGAHHFTCAMANLAFLVEFETNPELKNKENN